MSFTTQFTVALESVECANCGLVFAVSEQFVRSRRRDHTTFYCPMGHYLSYPGKSDLQKARDELTRERARLDQSKAEVERLQGRVRLRDRQVAARKAVATKLRKRIAAGTCPCCHTKFKDLAQHMKTNHPKWNPDAAAEAIAAKGEA